MSTATTCRTCSARATGSVGPTGATSGAVRLELQADCYAGVWANHATTVPGADGEILITEITNADLQNALQTAAAIGDDYIQTNLAGRERRPVAVQPRHLRAAAEVVPAGLPDRKPCVLQHLRHRRPRLITRAGRVRAIAFHHRRTRADLHRRELRAARSKTLWAGHLIRHG